MDTLVHSITRSQFGITRRQEFKPNFWPIDPNDIFACRKFAEQFAGYRKFIQNPPTSKRKEGIVYPNLSIHERLRMGVYSCNLHISYSVPKLLWGHSYKEATNTDKAAVLNSLAIRLKEMSVIVSRETLENSKLQTLHYAKNILFPDLEEAKIFLERLNKTSLGKWHENNVKTYSSDGKSVRFHTSIFEINFYLKYSDVLQKGSRSVDRQKTMQEINIAKEYQKKGKIPPVVRMEIRFTGSRSIRSHMQEATGTYKNYWTFNDAFDTELSRNVLQHYWKKIIGDKLNYFLLCKSTDADVVKRVQSEMKGKKSKEVDEAMGLYFRLKTIGVKELKDDMLLRHSYQTYKRKMDMVVDFVERFVQQDDKLIRIVSDALDEKTIAEENISEQLGMNV